MYREMSEADLPELEYRTMEIMVFATLKNHKWMEKHNIMNSHQDTHQNDLQEIGDGSKRGLQEKLKTLLNFAVSREQIDEKYK